MLHLYRRFAEDKFRGNLPALPREKTFALFKRFKHTFFSQGFNIFILRNEEFIETIMTASTFKKLPFKYTLSYET